MNVYMQRVKNVKCTFLDFHFLVFRRRRLVGGFLVDLSEVDMALPEQLLQLDPALDLLPEDLEDLGRGRRPSPHVPGHGRLGLVVSRD